MYLIYRSNVLYSDMNYNFVKILLRYKDLISYAKPSLGIVSNFIRKSFERILQSLNSCLRNVKKNNGLKDHRIMVILWKLIQESGKVYFVISCQLELYYPEKYDFCYKTSSSFMLLVTWYEFFHNIPPLKYFTLEKRVFVFYRVHNKVTW